MCELYSIFGFLISKIWIICFLIFNVTRIIVSWQKQVEYLKNCHCHAMYSANDQKKNNQTKGVNKVKGQFNVRICVWRLCTLHSPKGSPKQAQNTLAKIIVCRLSHTVCVGVVRRQIVYELTDTDLESTEHTVCCRWIQIRSHMLRTLHVY